MAKDDYFVIVAKILVFLYKHLKGKAKEKIEEYIQPNTKDFPISEDYMFYVMRHMYEDGLVEGVYTRTTPDGEILEIDFIDEMTNITPKGIAYLRENSMIQKAIKTVPAIASLAGSVL